MMRKYHAGFGREGACFLPDFLGMAAHSYLSRSILTAFTDLGHRVRKANLLRLGTESRVPFRSANPAALLQTAINGLESNPAVAERMRKQGVEPRQYFRRLLQASSALVRELRGLKEGTSPRTIAAGAVYLWKAGACADSWAREMGLHTAAWHALPPGKSAESFVGHVADRL